MSVFLLVPPSEWIASNAHAFAFRDRYPVSEGHTLIVTRRVVPDWFAASEEERLAVLRLVDEVKLVLDSELHPDGYNVGFNAGLAAGQTVMHLHVHVIPRYRGDMDDPRGGVRHVIPSKGNYLQSSPPLATGGEKDPFARHVLPLFERATEIAIVAAFVQESGLARIRAALYGALARGAHVRILTGDYLDITQPSALSLLLDWQEAGAGDEDDAPIGRFEARVVEVAALPGQTRSFHPKSWRFEAANLGVAFVGSSNLSRSALDTGIEWNLRVDRDRDTHAYTRVREAFEAAWQSARRLDAAWIQAYAERPRPVANALPAGRTAEAEGDLPDALPEPHEVQREALAELRESRAQGRRRALVVLATGLGKTWLAAFDYRQLGEELGRRPRLLFLAHRRELLRQAAGTYRRLLRHIDPRASVGWFIDTEEQLSADLVFASVAKLSRREHLEKLRAEPFDYVVVDEVHHAAAQSYRRILEALDPGFLLGLTATPNRADAADILGLFDDFIAYRADIVRGIGLGRLCPFHYYGVKDDIDYEHIPWKNRRFDPEALAAAAQSEARMQTLWQAWRDYPGSRSLVFCCSIAHANHVRAWLRARGVRISAVYSGEGSDNRDEALSALERGELDALCAVDIFNEGVDVPSIDRVVMLRPTESGVVFLQQLGRGLRASERKTAVNVIDFVGNHRVFIERVRSLLALAVGTPVSDLRRFLESPGTAELPEGCSVDLQLEAKQLLASLFRFDGADQVERIYRELRAERGARPTAGELQRMGYLPSSLREGRRHGSWFDFVRAEGDLIADELRVLDVAGAFLREVEITEMTKCFKMITLEALVEANALLSGMPLRDLALRCHALLRRSPELFAEIAAGERASDLDAGREKKWLAYWRDNPIKAWTAQKKARRAWFRVDGERFVLDLSLDSALEEVFARLTRELADYRLAQYRARKQQLETSSDGFVCKVTWNQSNPILKIPAAANVERLVPTDVALPDGSVWQFWFMQQFCNVARPPEAKRNQLPALLRGWFGPRAGEPGTTFQVRFQRGPAGLSIAPVRTNVIELAPRRNVVVYPDLRAAAGHAQGAIEPPDQEAVRLPLDLADADLFAVRVSGTSMDGGKDPLRDGDWAILRPARGAPADALANHIVLVQVPGEAFGNQYQIKRLVRRGENWILTSDNPQGPAIEPREDMEVIARLERAVRPEELAPPVGSIIGEAELGARFGLDSVEARSGRHGGHLFVFVDRHGMLETRDRLRYVPVSRRPGETAFTLAKRPDGSFQYLGVARQTDDDGSWQIPTVDAATWNTWSPEASPLV